MRKFFVLVPICIVAAVVALLTTNVTTPVQATSSIPVQTMQPGSLILNCNGSNLTRVVNSRTQFKITCAPNTTTTTTVPPTSTTTTVAPTTTTTSTTTTTVPVTTTTQPGAPTPNAPVTVGSLEFDSEFNGTSLDPGWAPNWFGDGHSMNNVNNYAANVTEANGYVALKLASSSSGALISTNPNGGATHGGFTWTYGYAEARIQFPGSGQTIYNWPAFWTDGQSWPTDGEIDIAEGLGTMTANYHDSQGAFNSPEPVTTQSVGGVWATYGVYWTPNEIEWFINGVLVHTLTSSTTPITSSPQYLIINNGAGHTASIGASILVDYVRVWAAS